MDDVLEALSNGQDDLQLLAACLSGEPDGIELSYRLLDQTAVRHGLADACLVLQTAALGPQVFFRGMVPTTPDTLSELLCRPPGLYGTDGGGPGPAMGAAVVGCCRLALTAQVAGASLPVAGTPRPLATRATLESALAGAAARSARYGWPVTVLVVRTPEGEPASTDRRGSVAVSLASVARTGDVVGDAGSGRTMAVLPSAGPEVVGALVRRLEAELSKSALAGRLEVATVRLPDETVDHEEVWRLVTERLGAGEGTSAASDWSGALPSDLELELRSLPGVVSVGTAGREGDGRSRLAVVALDASDGLLAAVGRRLAERFGEDVVPVTVVAVASPLERAPAGGPFGRAVANGTSPVPMAGITGGHLAQGPRPVDGIGANGTARDVSAGGAPVAARVALQAARFDATTGTSEVTVGRGSATATGRASAGPLAGGAQATLAALGVLGIEVPFYLLSVERARSVPGEPVVAVLAARDPGPSGNGDTGRGLADRIGVASGAEEVEAASRATLAALNRFLAPHPAGARAR